MSDNNITSNDRHDHPGVLEATAKIAAEAVGIPAAEGSDKIQPSDEAYHQHPPNAHYPTGPVHDIGNPGTPVKGGIISGKFKQAVGMLVGDNALRADGLDDEALALNRSGEQSHNVEEMRATRDKALELHSRAQEFRDAGS